MRGGAVGVVIWEAGRGNGRGRDVRQGPEAEPFRSSGCWVLF